MSSLTLVLSGNSSSLKADYFPPIELDTDSNYECCLIDFHTYNTIPNINETNNKLYVEYEESVEALDPAQYETFELWRAKLENMKATGVNLTDESKQKLDFIHDLDEKFYLKPNGDMAIRTVEKTVYEVPVGSYEMDDLIDYLAHKMPPIHITYDKNTKKTSIIIEADNTFIDFTKHDSLRNVFGFHKMRLEPHKEYIGEYAINITSINAIRVECNIVSGSFFNGKSTHTIHEFYPAVDPGYKIIEAPKNLIYLPVVGRTIQTLHFDIVDQNGNLIDFRGETITCRIHIKKV